MMREWAAEDNPDGAIIESYGAEFEASGYVEYVPATYDDPDEGGYYETFTFVGFGEDNLGLCEFVDVFHEELIAAGASLPGDDPDDWELPTNLADLAPAWCDSDLMDKGMGL